MARGSTLSQLRDQLRAEMGASSSVAMGVNSVPQMNHMLNRVQERLWTDYDWPFLWIEVDITSQPGVRYYNIPQEVNPDKITKIMIKWNDFWYTCENGIGPEHYNVVDSDEGEMEDEVRRWRMADEQKKIEVWPIPETADQTFRIFAFKSFQKMVSDSDKAMLDDTLIVMFTAAEMLASMKDEGAQIKYDQARLHFARLKAMATKNADFTMGGSISMGDIGVNGRKLWGKWKGQE